MIVALYLWHRRPLPNAKRLQSDSSPRPTALIHTAPHAADTTTQSTRLPSRVTSLPLRRPALAPLRSAPALRLVLVTAQRLLTERRCGMWLQLTVCWLQT